MQTPRQAGLWRATTWLIFWVTAASLFATIILWAGNQFRVPALTFTSSGWIVVTEWLLIVAPGTMGLLLGLRLPGNNVARLLGATGLLVALQNVADVLTGYRFFTESAIGQAVAWAFSTLTFAIAAILTVVLILVFPTGRLLSARWVFPVWLVIAGAVLMVQYQGLAPGGLTWYRDIPNPIALPASAEVWIRSGWYIGIILIGLALVAAGWSVVARYRLADPIGRQQLKWFVYGMSVLVVTALAEMAAFALLPRDSSLGELSLVALFVGAALLPIATAVAILRYGLYEIDVLIDRTFVFGALTAVLAGLYAAGIRLFNALFVVATGQESDAALVLTTLVLATTFTPIKQRLELVVARRYEGHGRPEAAPASLLAIADPPPTATLAIADPPPTATPAPGTLLTEAGLRALIADVVREELARPGHASSGDPSHPEER